MSHVAVSSKSEHCFLASPRQVKEVKDQHSCNSCWLNFVLFAVSWFFIYWYNTVTQVLYEEKRSQLLKHELSILDSCILWWFCPASPLEESRKIADMYRNNQTQKDLLDESLLRQPLQYLRSENSLKKNWTHSWMLLLNDTDTFHWTHLPTAPLDDSTMSLVLVGTNHNPKHSTFYRSW